MASRSMKGDVEWYRLNGLYPDERITWSDVTGEEYLIGDESWNDGRRTNSEEWVDARMDAELGPWIKRRA